MANVYRGSCLCGDVSLQVSGFAPQAAHCHCSMCRKFHGAAFATLVEVSDLQWLSGKALIKDFTSQNGTIRTFCQHCGSSIGFRCKGQPLEKIEVAIAMFDDNIPVVPDAHIYTQYKANWYPVEDALLQCLNGREG